jgi:hypothetical protein
MEFTPNLAPLGPLPSEWVFSDPDTLFLSLQKHAKQNRYSIIKATLKPYRRGYECFRSSSYNTKGRVSDLHPSKRRLNTRSMKIECPFRASAFRTNDNNWQLRIDYVSYNHSAALTVALPAHRIGSLDTPVRSKIRGMIAYNHAPNVILGSIREEHPEVLLVISDIYNLASSMRMEQLQGRSPIQWLFDVYIKLHSYDIS